MAIKKAIAWVLWTIVSGGDVNDVIAEIDLYPNDGLVMCLTPTLTLIDNLSEPNGET